MRRPNILMLDSGAFSAWNSKAPVNINEYIKFCHSPVGEEFEYIVNLDVIPGTPNVRNTIQDVRLAARQGWANYQKLLKSGISKDRLIHIFHMGEDFIWLKRLVDSGAPYIGLSPANDRTTAQKTQWLDACMKYVCDKDGMPIVKWHGFAVTSVPLMKKYPWYSVDSASWILTSVNGSVMLPNFKGGEYVYSDKPIILFCSSRSAPKGPGDKHIQSLTKNKFKQVESYVHQEGFKIGKSNFKIENKNYTLKNNEKKVKKLGDDKIYIEVIEEKGLINDYEIRAILNIRFLTRFQETLPEWPWAYKPTNTKGLLI